MFSRFKTPLFKDWVAAFCDYLKMDYFALDILTTDYTKNPLEYSYVLEINGRGDWLHHTFSEVKKHDIAGIILESLFGKIR